MKNIDRFSKEELSVFLDILSEYGEGLQDKAEKILDNMPGSLLGIAIDYTFDDTEVKDWIHLYAKEMM